jgi:hypothetical protein
MPLPKLSGPVVEPSIPALNRVCARRVPFICHETFVKWPDEKISKTGFRPPASDSFFLSGWHLLLAWAQATASFPPRSAIYSRAPASSVRIHHRASSPVAAAAQGPSTSIETNTPRSSPSPFSFVLAQAGGSRDPLSGPSNLPIGFVHHGPARFQRVICGEDDEDENR